MNPDLVGLSKFLSLVLRHRPETIGLALDANGWAGVDDLLARAAEFGQPLTRDILTEIVATNEKQRFTFSADGLRVRANQGHSLAVDLELPAVPPPEFLYHGTARSSLESILREGLVPGRRQHVHLAYAADSARKVGARHGTPVVLRVRALELSDAGHTFRVSVNGVWLTDRVPPEFLDVLEG